MRILEVTQGSPEWLAIRAKFNCASEAPVVMGASKYQTREDLVRHKATGIVPDIDSHKQALFDRGHQTEAAARVLVEEAIGQDLYPATVCTDTSNLLASLDGMTMGGDILYEHKLASADVIAQVRAGELEPHYFWQLEQQLFVTGAEKVIFVTSDGTRDNFHFMEYRPVPGRAEQLLAAWAQFEVDVATYQHTEVLPPVTGKAPDQLPALRIEVTGMVTASNLSEFKATALAAIGNVNRDLKTDLDFANAEKAVKWCGDIEDRLAAAKQHALSQTASIDALFKAIDDIGAEARRVRLDLDKLVKARKESIRVEIKSEFDELYRKHLVALVERIGKPYLPSMPADFATAIKGKKTVTSIRDACSTVLANAKIAANEVADKIDNNLKYLREHAKDHIALFADTAQIVLKAPDDLQMQVKSRISEHEESERKKADALAEQSRERIRSEEAAKLKAEQDAREKAERDRVEAEARTQREAEAKPAPQPAVAAPVNVVAMPARAQMAPVDTPERVIGRNTAKLQRMDLGELLALEQRIVEESFAA